jgi:peptidoglycan/xylan/chitin deacetylase (PgdA/CDA1 family)
MTARALRRLLPARTRAWSRRTIDDADARFVRVVARVREQLDTGDVALTFDDGPDPDSTPRVLDALGALDARATFFLVGRQAAAHPAIVRRIISEGHAIGSHSYDHPDPWELPLRALARNYRDGRNAVENAAGARVTRFRPPKGYLYRRGAIAIRAAGVAATWLWTLDPHDWQPGATATAIAASPPEAGAVWLLHDAIQPPVPGAMDRSETVAAIERIVHATRTAGRDCVVLPV